MIAALLSALQQRLPPGPALGLGQQNVQLRLAAACGWEGGCGGLAWEWEVEDGCSATQVSCGDSSAVQLGHKFRHSASGGQSISTAALPPACPPARLGATCLGTLQAPVRLTGPNALAQGPVKHPAVPAQADHQSVCSDRDLRSRSAG